MESEGDLGAGLVQERELCYPGQGAHIEGADDDLGGGRGDSNASLFSSPNANIPPPLVCCLLSSKRSPSLFWGDPCSPHQGSVIHAVIHGLGGVVPMSSCTSSCPQEQVQLSRPAMTVGEWRSPAQPELWAPGQGKDLRWAQRHRPCLSPPSSSPEGRARGPKNTQGHCCSLGGPRVVVYPGLRLQCGMGGAGVELCRPCTCPLCLPCGSPVAGLCLCRNPNPPLSTHSWESRKPALCLTLLRSAFFWKGQLSKSSWNFLQLVLRSFSTMKNTISLIWRGQEEEEWIRVQTDCEVVLR